MQLNMASLLSTRICKTEAAQEEIAAAKPDFIVTAAYGQILPEALLELPKFRAVNVHASLLPRYRELLLYTGALLTAIKKLV